MGLWGSGQGDHLRRLALPALAFVRIARTIMREWADFSVEESGGRTTVVVSGPLLVSSIGKLDAALRELAGDRKSVV